MNIRRIVGLGRVAALALSLPLFLASPASACRGKNYDEMPSSSEIQGFPFPDVIEGLPRKELRIPNCRRTGDEFRVLYGDEGSEWAEISIIDYGPEPTAEQRIVLREKLAKWMVENRDKLASAQGKLVPDKKYEVLSTDIGGKGGVAFLDHTADGREYKTISFTFDIRSKTIRLEYKSFRLPSAEERALAFRNSYATSLQALPGTDPAPQ